MNLKKRFGGILCKQKQNLFDSPFFLVLEFHIREKNTVKVHGSEVITRLYTEPLGCINLRATQIPLLCRSKKTFHQREIWWF